MKRSFWSILLVVGVLGLAACRTAPVYNAENVTVVSSVSKTLTADDVKRAIVLAGASLGWQISPVKNGQMLGTLHLRDHMAKVDITYSAKSYSIMYNDSENLNYDGANIHSNYNGWIQRLQQTISGQLAAM